MACILCYDVTDKSSFDKARFWAGELKSTQEVPMLEINVTVKDNIVKCL